LSGATKKIWSEGGEFGLSVTQRAPDTTRARRVEYDRLNQHYFPEHQPAELILHSMGVMQAFGSVAADDFLIDMNQLFGRFAHRKPRSSLRLTELMFEPKG